MRIRAPLAALTLAAIVAACGDDSRSPLPTQPRSVNPSVSTTALTCDPAIIRSLITQLYPGPSLKNAREGLLNKFSQGLGFMPNKQPMAWKKFVDIMRKVDDDFDAGRLPVLTAPTTGERLAELFGRLFACAGYVPPEFPTGGDVIVGIIDDPTIQQTFISSEGDFAVRTPPGFFTQAVVIIGDKKSDGFIVQSIYDEFPIKTEITASPPGKETGGGLKAIVKVCQYESDFDDEANRSFMRIVRRHNVGEGSVVDVLQFTTSGPFLICPESAPPSLISGTNFFSRSLATAVQALRGAGAFAVSAFAPSKLYAASALVDGGVGGFVEEFLSFYAGAEVPDLRIQSITVNPDPRDSDDPITFDIVVENIGFGQSPPSTLHYRIVNNAAPTVTVSEGDVDVDNIEGATDSEGFIPGTGPALVDLDGSLPAGSYTITVTADFPNEVGELNETAPTPFANNSTTQAFTVTPAPVITRIGTNGLGRHVVATMNATRKQNPR